MVHARTGGRRRGIVFALLFLTTEVVLVGIGQQPAGAVVTAVKGSACGYITNVGLFGGPQAKLGCAPQAGQPFAPATAATLSPSVELPPGGSATPITAYDPDGAAGKYGPAVIFGGRWPANLGSAPPSGPITVSTQGTTGAGGSVTSSTRIDLDTLPEHETANDGPGGFGPFPVEGDSMLVTCSASETSVTGSTTLSNAILATSTDADGEPLNTEPVPNNPPVNYTRHGVITNVGDVFSVVYNQQIVNPDGSLTVIGAHMYLFGPTAVGEVIKGMVTCGTTPSPLAPRDNVPPTCGTPVVEPKSPEDQTPKSPRTERVGVFDAGGLQSITNVQVTNGTVNVPPNGPGYLQFNPGQTGPLPITATRTAQAESANLPMIWSFDATDTSGNVTHCQGVISAASTSVTQGSAEPGDAIQVSGSGLTPSVSYRLVMGTTAQNCRTSSLVLGGNVVSSGSGTIGPVTRVIPANSTSGMRFLCWVRVGDNTNAAAADSITII